MTEQRYHDIWKELRALAAKMEELNIPPSIQAEALLKHMDRAKNKFSLNQTGLFDRLNNNETVKFWSDIDSVTEVSASKHRYCIEEEIRTINSPYDCTGKTFTLRIKQYYNKALDKYILIHHLGYDV